MSEKSISANILVVEDEVPHATTICEILEREGHKCTMVHDGEAAIKAMKRTAFDIVITDLMLGGQTDGLMVLESAMEVIPRAGVVLITAHSSVDTCRQALQNGAFDYMEKPLDMDDLRMVINNAARMSVSRRNAGKSVSSENDNQGFDQIVGASTVLLKKMDVLRRVARSDLSMLLLGESGTGKELFANAVHMSSPRVNRKLVAINCAGLSESLLEDELFGHIKGAYTGAAGERAGRFEHADGGTLFLDEVGDMPLSMQAKLLRVLENGEVVRVGSNEPVRVNVRLISATNSNLDEKIANNEFREDLYFRIKGATIEIPPLRQRREDIPLLVEHFIRLANEKSGTNVKSISPEVRRLLMSFNWPGNVRQLRNVVENMVVLASGDKLTIDDLPPEIYSPPAIISDDRFTELAGISIEEAERQLIANTLKMVDGNRSRAAGILGIGERTLYRKIKEYGLMKDE